MPTHRAKQWIDSWIRPHRDRPGMEGSFIVTRASNGIVWWLIAALTWVSILPVCIAAGDVPGPRGETADGAPESLSNLTTRPLLVGPDSTSVAVFQIDPATGLGFSVPAFQGFESWGAAYDQTRNLVYSTDFTDLVTWRPGEATATNTGTITNLGGGDLPLHGLASFDGTLYGVSFNTDTVYTIDVSTRVATPAISLPSATNISGLAADPWSGELYGTDDGLNDSLVRINTDGSVTPIAPYPPGEDDVDGLTISTDRRAYLITDDTTPGEIYVFDLVAGVYLDSVSLPWTDTLGQVSGAWIDTTATLQTSGYGFSDTNNFYTVFGDPTILPHTADIDPGGLEQIFAGELVNGSVYMVATDETIREVDAELGTLRRTYSVSGLQDSFVSGLARDPTTGTIYTSGHGAANSHLYTLDLLSGDLTLIGTISSAVRVGAIAIDGNGLMWGIDGFNRQFLMIDKTTANGIVIGPVDLVNGGDAGLAWDPITDSLYLTNVNPETGDGELHTIQRVGAGTSIVAVLGIHSPGAPNELHWLALAGEGIFADGFESGDFSAWTTAVP